MNSGIGEIETKKLEIRKKEIRKNMIEKRQAMSSEEVESKSQEICRRLLHMDAYKETEVVLAYMSIRNEVCPDSLIEQALSDGKSVYIPKVYSNRRMEFYLYDGEFDAGSFGIREPKNTDEDRRFQRSCLDNETLACKKALVLVPGVAFDKAGNRLGYGGGYYDTFLSGEISSDISANSIAGNSVTKIGIAYSFQLVDELPAGKNDVKVDMVILPEADI